jgi:hypothetical protein
MLLSRYGLEKLINAVSTMVCSKQSLQERLAVVGVYDLIHITPERDLPTAEMRDSFAHIMQALTSRAAVGDEGNIAASASAMDDDEASRHISAITELCLDLVRYLASHDRG